MDGVRFRPEAVRRPALAVLPVAGPVALVALLRQPDVAEAAVLAAVAAVAAALAALLALRPPSASLLRAAAPAGVLLLGAAIAASGGHDSPFVEVLLVPLVFAAAVFERRSALPTVVAYLAVRLAVVAAAGGSAPVGSLVLATATETAVAVVVAALAERMSERSRLDRLRARVSMAADADELEAALGELTLGADVVASAIVAVDGPAPVLAEVVAFAGRGASLNGWTVRVEPQDAFARAAVLGPVECRSDPDSPDAGARTGHERGYGSQAVLPLRADGVLLGHLVLCSTRPEAFPPRRLAALEGRYRPLGEAFASFLVRRERDARLRSALIGATLGRELAAAHDLAGLLDAAAGRMAELLGAPRVVVLAADDEDPALLRVVAAAGTAVEGVVDTRVEPSGAQTAMARGEPVFVPDAGRSPFVNPQLVARLGTQSALFLPVLGPERARGCISCSWSTPRMLRQDEIHLAGFVAAEVGAAWGRLEAERRLRDQASRDSLTGLLNHAAFHDHVRVALSRLSRDRGPVALILVDLDHLKHINDFHGHAAGDAAIRTVAAALRGSAREEDVLGRLGGDEFAWLLSGSPDDALTAAERAVAALRATEIPGVGPLSISAGVAVTAAPMSPETLFELADAALYSAKAEGRGLALLAGRRRERAEAEPWAMAHASAGHGGDETASVARTIVEEWVAAFRVGGAALSLLVEDGTALRAVAEAWAGGLGVIQGPGTYPLADYPSTARAIAERTTYSCSTDDPDADPAEVALLRHWNAGAVLVVPLVAGDRAVGIVELFDGRPRRFSGDERRLALVLGSYAAAMLERVVR